jgi:hypothetical protein
MCGYALLDTSIDPLGRYCIWYSQRCHAKYNVVSAVTRPTGILQRPRENPRVSGGL